ncbi:glycosyltransferase family 4 protein [candidate division WOR-3 bacterium]|nr:glycosyltransferase family 4 protein [candidate division WOR-3 bacterium]
MFNTSSGNILIISPWADDWDLKKVIGTPKVGVLIKGLLDKGFKIHLLIPKEEGFTNSTLANLRISPIPIYRLPKIKFLSLGLYLIDYLIVNFRFMTYGAKILREHSFDVIYGISSSLGLAIYWLGWKFHKPTILKLVGLGALSPIRRYNLIHWYGYIPEVIAYKLKFDKLVIVDDGTQGDKIAKYFKTPEERLLFSPQPIDRNLEHIVPTQGLKEKLGFEQNDYIVLFVSRLVRNKGADIAIRAMKLVIQKESRARLLIVGDGSRRKKYEELAKKLGICRYIKFIGSVRYQEVWKYYGIGDVFISANLVSNLCLPVVEAMASKVPVVTMDIRDTKKVIKDGKTGFLVRFKGQGIPLNAASETCRGIADAVCLLLNDANLREKIANKARELVLKQLPDWNEWIEMEVKLINSLK